MHLVMNGLREASVHKPSEDLLAEDSDIPFCLSYGGNYQTASPLDLGHLKLNSPAIPMAHQWP